MKNVALILFSCLVTVLNAQVKTRSYYADEGLVPRERSVDMTHLSLEVSFDVNTKTVFGKVTHDFLVLKRGVDTLFLDAVGIKVLSAKFNGESIDYKSNGDGVTFFFDNELSWDSKHSLYIDYEANPKKGLYFVGWEKFDDESREQIWTQGQGIDNRHWIPMYDEKNDKVTTDIKVEFDSKYKVLSNGKKLLEKKLKNGNTLWHYKMYKPHSTYLIMLGIGDYGIKRSKSTSGIPLEFYYYPEQSNQIEPTYKLSEEMFDFFEKEIGVPYPWENYSQIPVQEFMYGAMENTTSTIFGDFYLVDSRAFLDKNYVRVNAHELAHQWFGDLVTARSSAHHWLQESFATHYDMMYQKEAFGKDYFDWVRRGYTNQSLEATKTDLKPIAHSSAGTVRHYPKGAFVLQMLKYVVGRDQFNAAVKYYLEKNRYGNVDSKDLLTAFHDRLGMSLNWFWEQWIYKGGEPKYEVVFEKLESKLRFNVKQTHVKNELVGLFNMPIVFEIHYNDGTKESKRVIIDKESQFVEFNNDTSKLISYVLFDPNSEIMKAVEFEKPNIMLKNQAANAVNMIDRYDAILALRNRTFPNKNLFLLGRLKEEEFFGIRSEIIAQIMPLMNGISFSAVRYCLEEGDTELKKAILDNTFKIFKEQRVTYEKLLSDSSYQVVEKSLDVLIKYFPQNASIYLEKVKGLRGDRSHNVEISYLKHTYSLNKDSVSINRLVDFTSNSYEFLTRVKAARTLKQLNFINESLVTNLINARMSFNSRLRGPVSKVLDYFMEQEETKKVIQECLSNSEWSTEEFRYVKKYLFN